MIPRLELTYEHHDPCRSAHAVAVGLRRLVDLETGLDGALESARGAGAALTATSCSAGSPSSACPPRPPATVHAREHLHTWKTLLPCAKEEEAVVEYFRSQRPAYFVHLSRFDRLRAAA